MSYNPKQFEDLIVRTLKEFDLYSESAVQLLLGTCAVESGFGTYLRQKNGPALGAFQIEPKTFEWLEEKHPYTIYTILPESLEWDLKLSILVARLKYLSIPEPLPAVNDIVGMAAYWKKYYNTDKGAGTTDNFMFSYRKYLL